MKMAIGAARVRGCAKFRIIVPQPGVLGRDAKESPYDAW
jgi:hypothetical protein